MLQSNIGTFKSYSQFSDVKEFNNHIEQWLVDIKCKFTKGQLVAIKRLIRFCAKVPGIANAKIGTLVAATHENNDMGGISRSTFKRAVALAKEVGFLTVHELERKNGSKSSNLYVFNRYPLLSPNDEPSNKEKLNHPKTSNLSKTINQLKDNLRKDKPVLVKSYVDESFSNLANYFFEPEVINELWKISYINGKKYKTPSADLIRLSIRAIEVLISKYKTKGVRNVLAFYTAVIRKHLKANHVKNMFLSVFDN